MKRIVDVWLTPAEFLLACLIYLTLWCVILGLFFLPILAVESGMPILWFPFGFCVFASLFALRGLVRIEQL